MFARSAVVAALLVVAAPLASAEDLNSREDLRKAWILLNSHKFPELDAHLRQVVGRGRAKGDARHPLDEIVGSFAKASVAIAHLDSWCSASPRSPFPFVVRGEHRITWAWEARGNGLANTVTEDGWKKFRERISLAKVDLEHAYELDHTLPQAAACLVTVAMAQSDEEASERWFQRAIKADPKYAGAYQRRLQHLMPKWGGSEAAMQAFIEKYGRSGDPALAVVVTGYHDETAECSGDAAAYMKSPAVAADMEKAIKRFCAAYPRDPNGYLLRCEYASVRGEFDEELKAQEDGARVDPGMAVALAVMYANGKDAHGRPISIDGPKALRLLESAARVGDWGAEREIGRLHMDGKLLGKKDEVEAARWLERAAECEDPLALRNLAFFYLDGHGVRVDKAKAFELFERGANVGELECMKVLAGLLADKGEFEAGESWIRKRSEQLPERSFDWFLWCEKYRHGNLHAARALANQLLAKARAPQSLEEVFLRFKFFTSAQQFGQAVEQARDLFERAHHDVSVGLHLAIETSDPDERARVLAAVAESQGKHKSDVDYARLYAFAAALASQSGPDLDTTALDQIRAEAAEREQPSLDYFLGRLHEKAGDLAEAKRCYERCRDAKVDSTNKVFAMHALERLSSAAGNAR